MENCKRIHFHSIKNNSSRLLTSFVLFVISSSALLADQFHYNNILIGNRASGLAGSYVAVSDDPSGLFYNPSGVVYSSSTNVTANMNAYNFTRTKYINALKTANGKSVDWIRTSTALVPSFFGITQPLGPGTVGFSYAITDSILEDQQQTFNDIRQAGTKYTINFDNQDISNNVGPSYAIAIGEKFSVGLTLYGYFRNKKRIFNQIYQLAADGQKNTDGVEQPPFYISNQYYSLNEYGIKPILGFSYSPINKLSLGLTFTKTFIMSSKYEQQDTEASNICYDSTVNKQVRCNNGSPASFISLQEAADIKREFPWQINFGGAYFYSNRLMLTGSAWVYQAVNLTTKPLINLAGGLEFYITGKLAVRLGGYTNFANTPKLVDNASNVYNENINIVGGTFSLTHFTRSSAISIGAAGTYGVGKAQISSATKIQDVRYTGISIFLSASNSF